MTLICAEKTVLRGNEEAVKARGEYIQIQMQIQIEIQIQIHT